MRVRRDLAAVLTFITSVGIFPVQIARAGSDQASPQALLSPGAFADFPTPRPLSPGPAQPPEPADSKPHESRDPLEKSNPLGSEETRAAARGPSESQSALPLTTFTVDAFQTDLFTGAAAADIPILVPPGAAGTAPKIMLRYHSGTVDERGPRDQGQGTGLGWTLDIGGFILRDTKLTTSLGDDTFKLVFGGVGHDLVLVDGAQRIYHTKDEIFVRVQYDAAGDFWTLTTKDGVRHRYGFNTDSKALAVAQDLVTPFTSNYLLDEVTTASGVAVRYAYVKHTATVASTGRPYDQAVYPDLITWSYHTGQLVGPAREVRFLRAPRSDWTDTSPTTILSLFERERLDAIEVRVGATLVRKYVLGFDYSVDRDPTYTWGGGATGDLTLRSVTMYGADGVSTLPPLTLEYTNARLSGVSNGIGGTVSFTYEQVQLHPFYRRICILPASFGGCTGWVTSDGRGSATPTPAQLDYPGNLGRSDGATVFSVEFRGEGFPRLTTIISWKVGITNPELTVTTTGASVTLRDYVVTYNKIRHRVTSRTVNDGRGWTSTTSLDYGNIALSSDWQEFRGHGWVRAVDPDGHYTDTWFHQNDALKGRPSQTETRSSSGALYIRTVNTWATTNPYPGVTFAALSRSDVFACEGGATCRQTAESAEYDGFGNPTRLYHWGEIALAGDERDERTDWLVDETTWLHRPSRTALHDAAGTLLRERWLAYDGQARGALGSQGLLTREERRLAGSEGMPGNPVVTYSYDAYGNRTSTTDPRGCTTSIVYESDQTYPAAVTSCLGHTTSFAYDARWGLKTIETDPNSQTTTYAYDALGRLTTITGPLDTASTHGTASHLYLDWGSPSLQRVVTYRTEQHGTANFVWSEAYFDGLGRVYRSHRKGPDGQTIQSETTFEARGLVAARSAPHFASEAAVWTHMTYDPLGRPTQVLHPDGTVAATAYAPGLLTLTDETGHVKRTFSDTYGQPTRVEEEGTGTEPAATTYAYDATGALIRITNPLGHVTTMSYDALGRKVAVQDPDMGAWSYHYDLSGNLGSQTDAKQQTLTLTYDLQGRIVAKRTPSGAQTQWTYDDPAIEYSKGRLTQISDPETVTSFRYDPLGRVTLTSRLLDGKTYTMAERYDALGHVTSQTFPDGERVTYAYNEAGWLRSVSGYVRSLTYTARGQGAQVQYANGTTSTWTYHAQNFRLVSHSTTAPGSAALQNLSYTYDSVGNITQITDALYTGSRTFTYDALNRLTSASGPFGPNRTTVTETYRYDAIGNLLEKGGVLYTYADAFHPAAVTDRSDGKRYSYDANGNLVSGAGQVLTWDEENRLTGVTRPDGRRATFAYDYTGRRVRKTTSAGVTRYPFANYEVGADGVIIKRLGFAAKKSTGEVLFYHNDHLGGVNVITDATGARVQIIEYDPWGAVSRQEGTHEQAVRFTGQRLDPETGLMSYGGRYYDPVLGRFISPDPFVPQRDNPQALNRYAYVLNNPANFTDPSGFFWKKLGRFFKKVFDFTGDLTVAASLMPIRLHEEFLKTQTGRAVLGGVIIVGLGVATWYCGGCGAIATGALTGAFSGAVVGGVSAIQADGDLLEGVLFGAAVGAATGALAGTIAPATTIGNEFTTVEHLQAEWWGNLGREAARGAIQGVGVGAASGFGGGRGSLEGIVLAAVAGSVTAGVLNTSYFALTGYGATIEPSRLAAQAKGSGTLPYSGGVDNVGEACLSPGSSWACEGSGFMSSISRTIPGLNSHAGAHDIWQVWVGQAFGMPARNFVAIPTQFPFAAFNYATVIGIPPRAYGIGDE